MEIEAQKNETKKKQEDARIVQEGEIAREGVEKKAQITKITLEKDMSEARSRLQLLM